MHSNFKTEHMQHRKPTGAQILEHDVSMASQVADKECFGAVERRTDFATRQELGIIAEDFAYDNLVCAEVERVTGATPPAYLTPVFIKPPAPKIHPEIILIFGIVLASWVNVVVYFLT